MNGPAALWLVTSALAGSQLDEARGMVWSGHSEGALEALEDWLVSRPADLEGHVRYAEVRGADPWERQVAEVEFRAWLLLGQQDPTRRVALATLLSMAGPGPQCTEITRLTEGLDGAHALFGTLARERASSQEHCASIRPTDAELARFWDTELGGGVLVGLPSKRDAKGLPQLWREDPRRVVASLPALFAEQQDVPEHLGSLRDEATSLAESALERGESWVDLGLALRVAEFVGDARLQDRAQALICERQGPMCTVDPEREQIRLLALGVSPRAAVQRLEKERSVPKRLEATRDLWLGRRLRDLGEQERALEVLERAWRAEVSNPEMASAFAEQAITVGARLQEAHDAVLAGIAGSSLLRYRPEPDQEGRSWPDAYRRFHSNHRILVDRLNHLRGRLNNRLGREAEPVDLPPILPTAAEHLAQGRARRDRIGVRHLVQAVLEARASGEEQVESQALVALKQQRAWFLVDLDQRLAGWRSLRSAENALVAPNPAPVRPPTLLDGPVPDLQFVTTQRKKQQLSDIPGVRVVGLFTPDCGDCAALLSRLDDAQRAFAKLQVTVLALSADPDPTKTARFLEQTELSLLTGSLTFDDPSWRAAAPTVLVLSPEGHVVAEMREVPDTPNLRSVIGRAVSESTPMLVSIDAPAPIHMVAPDYPESAYWIGTPPAECLARVIVENGFPFYIDVEDCNEPFQTASRNALSQWMFEEKPEPAVANALLTFDPPSHQYDRLPAPGCFWNASVRQDGVMVDRISSCPPGSIPDEPIPWSTVPTTSNHRLISSVGSILIRGVKLPVTCHLVIDVYDERTDMAVDPGTCPEVLWRDALDAVRHWQWGDRQVDGPSRLVLRFEPPEDR